MNPFHFYAVLTHSPDSLFISFLVDLLSFFQIITYLYLPEENSQEILGEGCPFAEQGSRRTAPAETDVFWARHTHVGASEEKHCFTCYATRLIDTRVAGGKANTGRSDK